jgi:hypothetical protein
LITDRLAALSAKYFVMFRFVSLLYHFRAVMMLKIIIIMYFLAGSAADAGDFTDCLAAISTILFFQILIN